MKKPILLILCVIAYFGTNAQTNDTLKKSQLADTLNSGIKEPQFPGGRDSLNLFIMKNCRYPAISREQNKQGEEVIQILIDKDGHPSSVAILQSVSPEIDKEIVRVLSRSPRWIPATVNGNPVQKVFLIPITYAIKGNIASITPH